MKDFKPGKKKKNESLLSASSSSELVARLSKGLPSEYPNIVGHF